MTAIPSDNVINANSGTADPASIIPSTDDSTTPAPSCATPIKPDAVPANSGLTPSAMDERLGQKDRGKQRNNTQFNHAHGAHYYRPPTRNKITRHVAKPCAGKPNTVLSWTIAIKVNCHVRCAC